jgi:ABC-type transport system substrate-binding protein
VKRSLWSMSLIAFILIGCGGASTPPPPTLESTEAAPEATPTAALPGAEVVPLDSLRDSVPWLDLDTTARPNTAFILFNLSKQPFSNVLVRQAFAAATERGALAKTAEGFGLASTAPATTVTPSETLGRDLYNVVGIPFNPAHARDLLDQAGYADRSQFPPVTLLNAAGKKPEYNAKIAEDVATMWRTLLGVEVNVEILDEGYFKRITEDPPDAYFWGWGADYNDPDDFLNLVFHSGGENNISKFSNPEFDALVDQAADVTAPAERQQLYIEAERILCETEIAVLPLFHSTINVP